jgi:hypoxanthine phosphoribosyltransferase
VTGGALLAHTIAGLLDSRRSLTHPPSSFAPFNRDAAGGFALRDFYRREIEGKRVLLADDIRNTGETFSCCAALVEQAGGTVLATVEIYDRLETITNLSVPNIALAECHVADNYRAAECPLCKAGAPITKF